MRIKNSAAFLILIYGFVSAVNAQSGNEFLSTKNFTPPSPEASAMARYGDIPTDPSTGVPKIDIPVYEIRSGKLSVNLSLSYHASGIKVQDISTTVGLGWVLNSGGEISRNVVGKPDEGGLLQTGTGYLDTYKNRADLVGLKYDHHNGDTYFYMDDLAKGILDIQSDIYNYSSGDISGKFVYDVNKQLHFTPLDRQPKISWNYDSSFTVKDDIGNTYFYNDKDYTTNWATASGGGVGRYITSWHLTKIISADGQDSIRYFYSRAVNYREVSESNSLTVVSPITNQYFLCGIGDITASYSNASSEIENERKLIDSIRFSNGYVKFQYVNDRQDILPERLSKIKIGNTSDIVKQVELKQSYFIDNNSPQGTDSIYLKRMRLDSVKMLDRNNQLVGIPYSFEYSSTQLPAYHLGQNQLLAASKQTDYWGYFNGNAANTILPRHFYNELYSYLANHSGAPTVSNTILQQYLSQNQSASRYANPLTMGACTIKKINYPTGGYTAFEFEANRIKDNGDSIDYRGGLRVSKIISFDTSSRRTITKSYIYDSAISVSPWIPQDLSFMRTNWEHLGDASQNNITYWCFRDNFYLNANPSSSINYYNGSPVMYPLVTEYAGYPGENNGKTVYTYEFVQDSVYNPEYSDKFWNFTTDKSWARGNLLNTKMYKTVSGNYTLVKEIKNYYTPFKQHIVKVGEIYEQKSLISNSTNGLYLLMSEPAFDNSYISKLLTHFEYIDVYLSLGVKKLIKTEEIDYLNSPLTKTTELFYESPYHLYPTKTTTSTSKSNETISETTKYTQDRLAITGLTGDASTALSGMETANILAVPVEMETYRNSQFLFRNRVDFKNWGNGRFYEEFKSTQKAGSAMESRIQYKQYDAYGNPVTITPINGVDVSVIYGYQHSFPVAQVTGAAATDIIAYTSFETELNNDLGSWIINSGTAQISDGGVTGNKKYNLAYWSPYVNNLNSSKTYIVSYWSQGGSALVNGSSGVAKKTLNGWTLYEHAVSNSNSATVSGYVFIDELRLYPTGTQMSTNTYNPLVGVTSSCSVNDVITSYEYDNAARLTTVRDGSKNVIKAVDYAYSEVQSGNNVGSLTITGNSRVRPGINGFYTGILEREEKDLNPTSPTYNSTQWVAYDFAHVNPSWVATGQVRCKQNNLNENTGEQEGEFIDQNTYSTRYGKKTWQFIGYNFTSCPQPCNLPNRKIINGICEMGVRIDTGSYFDSGTGLWTCIYHYQWSDGSYSIDYSEYNQQECPLSE